MPLPHPFYDLDLTGFTLARRDVVPDRRTRVTLGEKVLNSVDAEFGFDVFRGPHGAILLLPQLERTRNSRLLHDNRLGANLRNAIHEADTRKLTYVGSFARYATKYEEP